MNTETWTGIHALPDRDLVERLSRRGFSAAYKARILSEVDDCSTPSEVGALLRRERLYLSHLAHWRAQQESGGLKRTLAPAPPTDPEEADIVDLQRRLDRLESELGRAHRVIAVQGRMLALLEDGGTPRRGALRA